jgi:hypothetical protein
MAIVTGGFNDSDGGGYRAGYIITWGFLDPLRVVKWGSFQLLKKYSQRFRNRGRSRG